MAGKDYVKTLTSFSGSDLIVNFGPKAIGELQQISWGVKREKAPVFTLGSPDARSFSRGKRGIGGSLVMAQFNRDALMAELVEDENMWKQIAPLAMFTAKGNLVERGNEVFAYALEAAGWNKRAQSTQNGYSGGHFNDDGTFVAAPKDDKTAATATVGGVSKPITGTVGQGFGFSGFEEAGAAGGEVKTTQAIGSRGNTGEEVNVPTGFGVIGRQNIIYADMIPPFDVTLTFANEYGQAAFQKIYDLEILDEQSGVSVDSIVMERAMSYIARRISSLTTGVYSRSSDGIFKGEPVEVKKTT